MNPKDVNLGCELVGLFEIKDNTANVEAFWTFIRNAANEHGIKLLSWGDETSMRQMLTERAKFISDRVSQ